MYWYKSDLRSFLQLCLSNPALLSNFNWQSYKRQIVSDLIDFLISNPEKYIGDLTKISYELCKITDFNHLKQLDDGTSKVERARAAVSQLKQLVEPHQEVKREHDEIEKRQQLAAQKLKENVAET